MPESATHKYIPRIEQRQKNLFLEEYYSSTDTTIYIDDEEQTEIGYISYSMNEQLLPLYGYASRTFDEVSVGNRVVNGVIKVPIKNPDPQTQYEDAKKIISSNVDTYNEDEQENLEQSEWVNPSQSGTNNNEDDYEVITDKDRNEYITKLSKLGYNIDTNASLQKIQDIIAQFQKRYSYEPTGLLDDSTKRLIDGQFEAMNLEHLDLPVKCALYQGPDDTYNIDVWLEEGSELLVITQQTNGWKEVYDKLTGKKGWIKY